MKDLHTDPPYKQINLPYSFVCNICGSWVDFLVFVSILATGVHDSNNFHTLSFQQHHTKNEILFQTFEYSLCIFLANYKKQLIIQLIL